MAAQPGRTHPQASGKGTYIGNFVPTLSPTTPRYQGSGPDTAVAMEPPEASRASGFLSNLTSIFGPGSRVYPGDEEGGDPFGYDLGGLPYEPSLDLSNRDSIRFPVAEGVQSSATNLTTTASSLLASTADAFASANGNVSFSPFDFLCDDNDTFCPLNFTMGNDTRVSAEYKYWTMLLVIFPVFTVFGNVLVVLSVVREKSLKTVTNYFICSLAVADIMVAVIVMPFAVYLEVAGGWYLSDLLCDAWVASDVMACTASILNLTAISVDRFIAVTQPIKYAKHKNSKRVYIMIAITWIISVAIAAPISLGVNYSSSRVFGGCSFYNADFIIYSSMGSFYIPSIVMIFLYWKIYRVIRLRAEKAKAAKKVKTVDQRALQSVIENTGATSGNGGGGGGNGGGNGATVNSAAPPVAGSTTEPTVTTGLAKMDNGRVTSYNTTGAHQLSAPVIDDASVTNVPSQSDSHNEDEDDSNANITSNLRNAPSPDHVTQLLVARHHSQDGDLGAELIANPGAAAAERREAGTKASTSGSGSGTAVPNEAETPFNSPGGSARKKGGGKNKSNCSSSRHKKGVTKFNFHMRTSRKRKEKSSSRREKKATKTLAIVLGVFLFCWVPFFTLNIINAICIRYETESPLCNMDQIFFGLFVWLGYINSFLNPVIYTIFNPEFRKAFKKILTEPCPKGRR